MSSTLAETGQGLTGTVRERLVTAATAVISEVGEDQLTLAQVVRRADLTTGAVYSNFENREELVIAVYVEQYAERMWEGVKALERLFESDLRGAAFAEAMGDHIIRPDDATFRTSRWVRIRAVGAAQRYPHVRAAVSDLQRRVTARLVELIEQAQSRGDIDPARDTRSVALLLQQFGFTLVLSDLSGDLAPEPDEWVDFARDLIMPLFAGRITEP